MKKKETSKSGGWFTIEHRRNGKLLSRQIVHNVLSNTYFGVIAGLAGNVGSQSPFVNLALGTDSTPAVATQSALIAETVIVGLARAAATVTRTTTTQANDTLSFTKTFTHAGGAGTTTIQEVGIFNAANVMACRAVISPGKPMLTGDQLSISYVIQYT